MNPLANVLDAETDLNNYNFIVADYDFPKKEGDYYISEVNFDLSRAWRDKDGYTFLISAPFLKDLNEEKYIEIVEVEIELRGRSLLEKIKELLKRFRS